MAKMKFIVTLLALSTLLSIISTTPIVQKNAKKPGQQLRKSSSNSDCLVGFQGYNKSICYETSDYYAGWQDSEYWCATAIDFAKGQHLASIHDAFTNNWLIGALRTDDIDNEFWLGLTKTITGNWTWVDKTPLDYVNWASGQPHDGQCAAMNVNEGKWYSKSCDSQLNCLCEYLPKN